MPVLTQKKILNVIPGTTPQLTVHCSQDDTGSAVEFELYAGSVPFLPNDAAASVQGIRKDGSGFGPSAVTISGSTATVTLSAAMTGVYGPALCEITITEQGGSVSTANFALLVEKAAFPNGPLVENSVDVYQQILQYVQSFPATAEASATAKVAAEAAAREAADNALSNSITENASAISAEVANRQNADLEIQTQISSLMGAVGTPLVASSVAAMTNTSKIYVYTGSEAGYVNGNWYYWNGAAWVSGGVYNSTAFNTDKTLTVSGQAADAKVTGYGIRNVQSQRIVDETNILYTDDYYTANSVCKSVSSQQLVFTTDLAAFHLEIPVTAHDRISFPIIDNSGHGYVLAIVLQNGNSTDQWTAATLPSSTAAFISITDGVCTVDCDVLAANRTNPAKLVLCQQYANEENFYIHSLLLGRRSLGWLDIPKITAGDIDTDPVNLGTLDGAYTTPGTIYANTSGGKLVASTNNQAFSINIPLIPDDTVTLQLLNNAGYGYVVAITDESLTAYNQFTYATLTDGTVRNWISVDASDVATISCAAIKRNYPNATRLIFCGKKVNIPSYFLYSAALVERYVWLGASPYDNMRIVKLEELANSGVITDPNFPGGYYVPGLNAYTDFDFGTAAYPGASAEIFAALDDYVDGAYCTKELLYTESSGLNAYVYKFLAQSPVVGQTTGIAYDPTHPTVIIVASQHGTERNAAIGLTYFLRDLMTNYETNPLLNYIRTSVNLIVVPVGNVYGFDHYTHGNANGVDINRNYNTTASAVGWAVNGEPGDADYSGAAAGDQIETQAIQALFDAYPNATLYVDFHTYGGATAWYQQNWHMLCQPPYSTDLCEEIGKWQIQRQTINMANEYGFDLSGAPFIGYVSRDSRTGNSKIYARYIGIKNALVFEGTNQLPGEDSAYSATSKKYCCELIGNYICNSLAWMVANY